MKQLSKRILSFLAAVAMTFSLIPVVSAENEQLEALTPAAVYGADQWIEVGTADELKAALANGEGANAEANGAQVMGVKLKNSITVTKEADGATAGTMLYVGYCSDDGSVTRGQAVVLDLGGHTLTTEGVERSQLFGLYGSSDLTVTNGVIEQGGTYTGHSAAALYQSTGKLTVDGVKWTLSDTSDRAVYGGMFHLGNSANTLTVLNSNITVSGSAYRGGILHCAAGSVSLANSTFTGGHAVGGVIGSTTYRADGGQIWLAGAVSLTAENCAFIGGKADRNGGLIFKNAGAGKLTFTKCTFSDGQAVSGGGLFLGTTGAVSFDECEFLNNAATSYGGAVYKDAGSGKLTVTDTTFTGGNAVRGGHIYTAGTNAANRISGCTFTGAAVTDRGGSLYISGKLTMEDSSVTGNTADKLGGGALVTGSSTAVTFTNCTMNNTSDSTGGSIAKYGKGTLTLNEVDITGTAVNGGSMIVGNGTVILNSGSIHDGKATTGGGNIQISRDGTVESQNLSYGLFIMNGGTVTGGEAKYGGNIRIYNGRAIINDGEISGGTATGTGPDIQVYSKAAAETVSYVGTSTVDLYDCLYIFGGKIGGLIASSTMVSFVNGYAAAEGGYSDMAGYLGDHCEISAEADGDGYLAVTHKNTDEGNDTLPTCTEGGVINVVCADCVFQSQYDGTAFGGAFTYEKTAMGHDYVADVKAPSCQEPGYTTFTCANCGDSYETDHVDAPGHTPVVDAAVAPGCGTTGLTEGSHCDACGTVLIPQEEVAALTHQYESVYTAPTFEADGYTTYTCANCGDSYKEIDEGTQLVRILPVAQVTPMDKLTLEDGSYRVWNGLSRNDDPNITEDKALTTGVGELPLEVVVNFKAIDTLEDCLNGGYAQWLVDFNITIEGLTDGSFTADNCYLAGNYGSYGWIKIPLDGQSISEGIAYPVVALYDNTLNYKDICKSVKDFTAAIHIDQAILNANPHMTVKLELVMTNPADATDTLQIGEDLIYGVDALSNGTVAKNAQTGKLYTNVADALLEAENQTVVLLCDVTSDKSLAVNFGTTLDLNGYTLHVKRVSADADSHIVDSTNGKGLLSVTGTFTLSDRNAAIPVKTEDGYRFTALEFVNQYKNVSDHKVFRAYFVGEVGEDATSMLATELADGGADNGLTIRVKLTYTDLTGTSEGVAVFAFSDALVQEYAEEWVTKDFRVTIKGAEKVANLQATLEIVSTVGDQTVIVSGETIDLTK